MLAKTCSATSEVHSIKTCTSKIQQNPRQPNQKGCIAMKHDTVCKSVSSFGIARKVVGRPQTNVEEDHNKADEDDGELEEANCRPGPGAFSGDSELLSPLN